MRMCESCGNVSAHFTSTVNDGCKFRFESTGEDFFQTLAASVDGAIGGQVRVGGTRWLGWIKKGPITQAVAARSARARFVRKGKMGSVASGHALLAAKKQVHQDAAAQLRSWVSTIMVAWVPLFCWETSVPRAMSAVESTAQKWKRKVSNASCAHLVLAGPRGAEVPWGGVRWVWALQVGFCQARGECSG